MVLAALILVALVVLFQDIFVFPGAFPFFKREIALGELQRSNDSEFFQIIAADGERLEGSLVRARGSSIQGRRAAIVLSGNGDSLPITYGRQKRFAELGYNAYAIDYRGYGNSSGWPSEAGIYLDVEALLNYVNVREGIPAREILIAGFSLGSGPAAYLAAKFQSKVLILLAPYTSIPEVAKTRPILGLLAPLVWTTFPVKWFVSRLQDTCVIDYHGNRDQVVPFEHSQLVEQAAAKTVLYIRRTFRNGGHLIPDIFLQQNLPRDIKRCEDRA